MTNNVTAVASASDGSNSDYTLVGSQTSIVTNYSNGNSQLAIVQSNNSLLTPDGTTINAQSTTVQFSMNVSGGSIVATDVLTGGLIFAQIQFVSDNSNSTLLRGDVIEIYHNTTFVGYLSDMERAVQSLIPLYISSGNSTLRVMGYEYAGLALALPIESLLVQWLNPSVAGQKVILSTSIILDSISCTACIIAIQVICLLGCAAVCFLSLGTACGICVAFADQIATACGIGGAAFCHYYVHVC